VDVGESLIMVAGGRERRDNLMVWPIRTRTTASLRGQVNRDGSKLLILLVKRHVQVGVRFQERCR